MKQNVQLGCHAPSKLLPYKLIDYSYKIFSLNVGSHLVCKFSMAATYPFCVIWRPHIVIL